MKSSMHSTKYQNCWSAMISSALCPLSLANYMIVQFIVKIIRINVHNHINPEYSKALYFFYGEHFSSHLTGWMPFIHMRVHLYHVNWYVSTRIYLWMCTFACAMHKQRPHRYGNHIVIPTSTFIYHLRCMFMIILWIAFFLLFVSMATLLALPVAHRAIAHHSRMCIHINISICIANCVRISLLLLFLWCDNPRGRLPCIHTLMAHDESPLARTYLFCIDCGSHRHVLGSAVGCTRHAAYRPSYQFGECINLRFCYTNWFEP